MSILDRTNRHYLITILEGIGTLNSPEGRGLLILDIPIAITKFIVRSPVLHIDLTNIVKACDEWVPAPSSTGIHPLGLLIQNAQRLVPHSTAASQLQRLLEILPPHVMRPEDTDTRQDPVKPRKSRRFATTEAAFEEGCAILSNGDYDNAIIIFIEIIRLKPDFAEAYYNLGVAYYYKENYEQAVINYTLSIDIKPTFDGYWNRGRIYEEYYNDYAEAISDYSQALHIRPHVSEIYYRRGKAYLRVRRFDAAIDDLTESILRTTGFAAAYYARAESYKAIGNMRKALADYELVLKFSNDFKLRFLAEASLQNVRSRIPWWWRIIDKLQKLS